MNNSKRTSRPRDTSPTAVASVPETGLDVLAYRGIDSKTGRGVYHLKIARRNRAGDGYYATYRVEEIIDVILACQFAAAKFALVEELPEELRSELSDLASGLGAMLIANSSGGSAGGKTADQRANGLASAFGHA